MMFYFVKTPWLLKMVYPHCVWHMPGKDKIMYLTFDDGPHPEVTPWVLDTLARFQAKATFFCLGKNVAVYPEVYRQVLQAGHAVGNHTYQHVNGWEVSDEKYIQEVRQAAAYIDTTLFRPPYGRIRRKQIKLLKEVYPVQIIMWDVLSADFDTQLSAEQCADNVMEKGAPGSIVIFHDSAKAYERLKGALPKVLEYFSEQGYRFNSIK